ncbi:hypothetical protein V8G54_024743, partial [Vigna mungo]
IDSATTTWKDLKDHFSQGDSVRISQLHQDLYSIHQSDLSVTAYYTKMKILWDELFNFHPIPECQSSASCCGISKTMKEYRENDCVLSFLRGLNNNYYVVRYLQSWRHKFLNINVLFLPSMVEVNPFLLMIMAGESLHIEVLRHVPQGEGLMHLDNALNVVRQTTPLILAF